MIHAKKVLPEYFAPLRDQIKCFELRKEEQGEPIYLPGDYLALNEYDEKTATYTGRAELFEIVYRLHSSESCGTLTPGSVALGLCRVRNSGMSFDGPKRNA